MRAKLESVRSGPVFLYLCSWARERWKRRTFEKSHMCEVHEKWRNNKKKKKKRRTDSHVVSWWFFDNGKRLRKTWRSLFKCNLYALYNADNIKRILEKETFSFWIVCIVKIMLIKSEKLFSYNSVANGKKWTQKYFAFEIRGSFCWLIHTLNYL